MTTVRLAVEYDGTGFHGFQWQPQLRTVAGTLETALQRLLGEEVKVAAAGRTDAGVHACGQVVSFSTDQHFPFDRLDAALNATLPGDIAVCDATVVADEFSARFSAIERTYVYAIFNRRQRSPLFARRAYRVWCEIDVDGMCAASAHLLGQHDFRSFCASPSDHGIT